MVEEMARPLLRDVAALARVSEPTVSRVLNGRTGVAAPTRERVIAALEHFGYTEVPEPSAIRRGVVGVVAGGLLNPVFPTFLNHLAETMGQRGYLTTVAIVDEHLTPEERCVREFGSTRVDGVVFLGGRHAEVDGDLATYRRLVDAGTAVVLVNGADTGLPVPHIRCDEGQGAAKAMEHLLGLGHRRIGCVLGSDRYVPSPRITAAYRAALARAGIDELDGDVIFSPGFTSEEARAATSRLLEREITAIVAGNDLMALGAIQAARLAGKRVPEDLSVVGYDGTALTGLTSPALTTLRQPIESMTRLIADAVCGEIDGSREFRDHFVFEPQLVVRESTGPCSTPVASPPPPDSLRSNT